MKNMCAPGVEGSRWLCGAGGGRGWPGVAMAVVPGLAPAVALQAGKLSGKQETPGAGRGGARRWLAYRRGEIIPDDLCADIKQCNNEWGGAGAVSGTRNNFQGRGVGVHDVRPRQTGTVYWLR